MGRRSTWVRQVVVGVALPLFMSPAAIALSGRRAPVAPSASDASPSMASPRTEAPAPQLAQRLNDPTEQDAPAGLDVQPGSAPINTALAIAMRQELTSLVGRFESALLAANAATLEPEIVLGETAPILTASLDGTVSQTGLSHPALTNAERLLTDWSDLLARRRYGEARRRWLAARQRLWSQLPVDRPLAQTEIRAMWLDRGTLVRAGSRQGLDDVFERLAAAGINTVFVETVNAGYPIYPSRIAPQQNPLTRHWDPLAAAVAAGKTHGIEVHAWVWIFAAGNQRHNAVLNLPNNYLGPLLNANRAWAGYDRRGNIIPRGQTKPFLDPGNPEVRSYLMRILNEIVANYDVDGVQFDYIRYPFQDPDNNRTYGYGTESRLAFRRMTGIDPAVLSPQPNPRASAAEQQRQRRLWNQWTDFRINLVNSFVAEASQTLRRRDPDLTISAAVFAYPRQERLQKLQQDWETWAERGDVDWIVLMSYALDTNRFEQLIRPWVLESDYDGTLVIPGIRLLQLSHLAAFDQIQALRDLPAPGYALFAVDNLNGDIQSLLGDTQSLPNQPIPQQAPFAAAADRYQSLQREWRWLLAHQQMRIDAAELEQWVSEVNTLGEQLAALAEEPSRTEVRAVRSRLTRLRTTLDDRINLDTSNSPYRQRTWQHRLRAVDNLLVYGGERVSQQ
ncbi:MAG: family 10 glycosylhydrolase [Cyanobacteria bacterium P01_A01_bin.105]